MPCSVAAAALPEAYRPGIGRRRWWITRPQTSVSRPVDEPPAGVAFDRRGARARAQRVGVIARRGGHHRDGAAVRFERDDRAFVAGEGRICDLLGARVEGRDDLQTTGLDVE